MCKVNFVDQFNLMMEYFRENYVHSRERMLMIALFYTANRRAQMSVNYEWPDDFFPVSISELNSWCDLDKRSIQTLRNSLKQRGLIDFNKGSRNKSQPTYKINYLVRNGYRIEPMSHGKPVIGYKNEPNNEPSNTPNIYPNSVPNSVPNIYPNSVPNNAPIYININPNVKTNVNENDDGSDGARGRQPEADRMIDMAARCGFALSENGIMYMNRLRDLYTEEWVIDALEVCVKSSVIRLDYLETVLKNRKAGIGKPDKQPKVIVKEKRQGGWGDYQQRQYEPSTGMPDWMKQMMADEQRKEEESCKSICGSGT